MSKLDGNHFYKKGKAVIYILDNRIIFQLNIGTAPADSTEPKTFMIYWAVML